MFCNTKKSCTNYWFMQIFCISEGHISLILPRYWYSILLNDHTWVVLDACIVQWHEAKGRNSLSNKVLCFYVPKFCFSHMKATPFSCLSQMLEDYELRQCLSKMNHNILLLWLIKAALPVLILKKYSTYTDLYLWNNILQWQVHYIYYYCYYLQS